MQYYMSNYFPVNKEGNPLFITESRFRDCCCTAEILCYENHDIETYTSNASKSPISVIVTTWSDRKTRTWDRGGIIIAALCSDILITNLSCDVVTEDWRDNPAPSSGNWNATWARVYGNGPGDLDNLGIEYFGTYEVSNNDISSSLPIRIPQGDVGYINLEAIARYTAFHFCTDPDWVDENGNWPACCENFPGGDIKDDGATSRAVVSITIERDCDQ